MSHFSLLLQFHGASFAVSQHFHVDHVALSTAFWLFKINPNRASLLIQV